MRPVQPEIDEASSASLDVAVIGMAGRFPGADDLAEFWRNLRAGVSSIERLSKEELRAKGTDVRRLDDPRYVLAAPLLRGVEEFDAAFFDISPAEASIMDPQRRLFMEQCWAALESAGYVPEKCDGAIGVFAGAGVNTYMLNNLYENRDLLDLLGDMQVLASNDKDGLPMQTSYHLNLTGPSVNVNTTCSSGLVAVHLARQSLLLGESDIALAGASALVVPNRAGYLALTGGILSPDGTCRPFDAQARGTLWGSGVGVVVLKRLNDAIEDGDNILAVLKGSAINNDGSLKVGYLAPSVEGQAEVLAQAYACAGVSVDSVGLIEAHGTGTEIGDPIEVAALTQVFREHTDRRGYCALGSVKSNIGHLGAAAGIVSMIKAVLSLQHRQLPPTLNFERPNPLLRLEESPFYVNTDLRPWPSDGEPRRAGVSSFGVGGTNAHMILEEHRRPVRDERPQAEQAIVVSARTEAQLRRAIARLADHLCASPELALADVAHTLQHGRRDFVHRAGALCTTLDEAVAALQGKSGQLWTSAEAPPASDEGSPLARTLLQWLGGEEVEWPKAAERAQRVSLPTYPFERTRHWIEPKITAPEAARAVSERGPHTPSSSPNDWFYSQLWVEAPFAGVQDSGHKQNIWVLQDDVRFGERVSEWLELGGAQVVRVSPGSQLEAASDGSFCVDYEDPEQVAQLVSELARREQLPDLVVHLLNMSEGGTNPVRRCKEAYAAAQGPALLSLVNLVRGLARAGVTRPLEMVLYSSGIHDVTGDESLHPEKAGVLSACKVLRQEYPNLFLRTVDLSPARRGDASNAELVQCVAREACAGSRDLHVCYRGRKRWRSEYRPAGPTQPLAREAVLKREATYLIVGGFAGGIGAILCNYLIERYGAKLVLLEDADMPARESWDRHLANDDLTSLKIGAIRALEARGARYLGTLRDYGQLHQLRKDLSVVEAELGALAGVIHGAGSTASGKLMPVSLTNKQVLEDAVTGGPVSLVLLDELIAGRPLDFKLLMVSLSSAFGGPGFFSYSASNAISSAYVAAHNREPGLPWLECWWDSPKSEFEGPLEASMQVIVDALGDRLWRDALSDEETASCFERTLQLGWHRPAIICKSDFEARYDAWVRLTASRPATGAEGWLERPALDTEYAEPRTDTERVLTTIFERLLGVRGIGIHDSFFELGGQSLLTIQLVARMREELGADIGVEAVLFQPTVAALAESLPASATSLVRAAE
jgi:acyl transferase domain-containing protein